MTQHKFEIVWWTSCEYLLKTILTNETSLIFISELNLDEKDNNRLTLFVRSASENYLNISQMAEKEELGNKVTNTANR